jgi:hypothetical protein
MSPILSDIGDPLAHSLIIIVKMKDFLNSVLFLTGRFRPSINTLS